MVSSQAESDLFFFDHDELQARASELHDVYVANSPFPHVAIDGLLPSTVAEQAVAEFPAPEAAPFEQPDNEYQVNKLGRLQDKALAGVSPFLRHLLAEFNSMAFLDFLETLAGIDGLIGDPHLEGGALHQILPGGSLAVHADFNRDLRRGLVRRMNVLLYLNPDWQEEWAGHLELWNRDMSRCEARIAPVLNRCVIFETTSTSFHGHPDPLDCPPGVYRRSLAFYYYSKEREGEQIDFHGTLWQARPGSHDAPSDVQVGAGPSADADASIPVGDPEPVSVEERPGRLQLLEPFLPPIAVDRYRSWRAGRRES